jgi:putative membrane protein
MGKFDISFRNELRKKVEAAEIVSGAELVVAILPRASNYLEYFFGVGIALAFAVLTVMMFIPLEIWYVYIYFETIGAGFFGAGCLWLFRPLLLWIVGKKELQSRTEHCARAIFKQAQIYETRSRVGVLMVFFWLERIAVLMPDKGILTLVPPDELELLQARLNSVFTADDPPLAVLGALDFTKDIFARYVPAGSHPINELPDELWIE